MNVSKNLSQFAHNSRNKKTKKQNMAEFPQTKISQSLATMFCFSFVFVVEPVALNNGP